MRRVQDVDVLSGGVRGLRLALPVAAAVVIADQLTKLWALSALTPGSCNQQDACIDLVAGARFHLVFNTGASFSTGTGFGPILAILAAAMTGVLLYMARLRPDRWGQILLGGIAGGAVGNLIDRIYRAEDGPLSGGVVDFIDLGWWPVFNVADSAIVGGVIVMILLSLIYGDGQTVEAVAGDTNGPVDELEPADDEEADRAEVE